MKHLVVTAVVAAFVGLVAVACDDNGGHGHGGLRGHGHAACRAQTTCGTCTPIVGCGWCAAPGGGTCVDGPDDCGDASTSFTWDPPGCDGDGGALVGDGGRVLADAQVGDGEASDSGADDAATDAPND